MSDCLSDCGRKGTRAGEPRHDGETVRYDVSIYADVWWSLLNVSYLLHHKEAELLNSLRITGEGRQNGTSAGEPRGDGGEFGHGERNDALAQSYNSTMLMLLCLTPLFVYRA